VLFRSQAESGHLPKTVVPALLAQKTGPENAGSFPTEKGVLVAYVKRIIPSKEKPTDAEMQEAAKDWNQDLKTAVERAYIQKYPVDIRTHVIQKAFSIYDSQDE